MLRVVPRDRGSGGFGMLRTVSGLLGPVRAGEEHQPELADLYLVAVPQQLLLHEVAVDVGAVQAAQVLDHDALVGPGEGGVASRHRDVVEEDVGVLVPAGRHLLGVDEEPRAGVRAALHDEQSRPRRQPADGGLLLGGQWFGVFVDHRRGGVWWNARGDPFGRLTARRGEGGAALPAEVASVWVVVAAVRAEGHQVSTFGSASRNLEA